MRKHHKIFAKNKFQKKDKIVKEEYNWKRFKIAWENAKGSKARY